MIAMGGFHVNRTTSTTYHMKTQDRLTFWLNDATTLRTVQIVANAVFALLRSFCACA